MIYLFCSFICAFISECDELGKENDEAPLTLLAIIPLSPVVKKVLPKIVTCIRGVGEGAPVMDYRRDLFT